MLDTLMTYRSKLSTGIFMAMLCLPLLGHLFSNGDEAIPLENRTLASFPGVANLATDWPGYTSELNTWIEDRVGFRNALIRLHGQLRDAFDLEPSTQAVIGDDGWYFITLHESLKMHQGLFPYNRGQAEDWLRTAQKIQDVAQSDGAKFLVLIAPNKHEIYGEHLSNYPVRLQGLRPSETLQARGPEFGVTVVYPEAELLAAKAGAQVYYKTDTHWTSAGAFIGYEATIDAANKMGLSLDKIDGETQITISERHHDGDIYGLLGQADGEPETILDWRLKAPRAFEREFIPEYDWQSFKAFRVTARDSSGPSVLVLGDSFAGALQPFLRESFSEVTFVHYQSGEAAVAALEAGSYDLVVLELAERSLSRELELQVPEP